MGWSYTGKIYLPLTQEMVYPLISTQNGLKKWFVRRCQIDPRPGGRLNMTFARNDIVLARITKMVAGELFCFEWPVDDVRPVTQVEIKLEPLGNGTMLKLTDGEFEEDIKEVKRFQTVVQGWTGYLWNLKSVAVFGADLRNEWE
jgi:uncharacterized protein YndB with AHSA1/START domain